MGEIAAKPDDVPAGVAEALNGATLLVEQRQGGKGVVIAFVVQAGQQDMPIGQHDHLARRRFETLFKRADHVAAGAEVRVNLTVVVESRQPEPTAVGRLDPGCHQDLSGVIEGQSGGQARGTVFEMNPGFAVGGKAWIKLPSVGHGPGGHKRELIEHACLSLRVEQPERATTA